MKNLTTTLCLTIAVLLGSVGVSLSADKLMGYQKEFYDKNSHKLPTCVQRATQLIGSEKAEKFCECQAQVFARNLTKDEMRLMEHGNESDGPEGMNILMRVPPIREEKCGM